MSTLPTGQRFLDAARRIRDEHVELAHDEPPAKDFAIAGLHADGLIRVVFTPAFQRRPDYWRLTAAGTEWLRDAEADAMWSHTGGPNP